MLVDNIVRGKRTKTADDTQLNTPQARETEIADDLGKVRELLFGTQLRRLHGEVDRIDDKLMQQISYVREDIRTFEKSVSNRIDELQDVLTKESETRRVALDEVDLKRDEIAQNLASQIAEVRELTTQADNALRDELIALSKLLGAAIDQRHEAAVSLVNEKFDELRTSKADRTTLAETLIELASNIEQAA